MVWVCESRLRKRITVRAEGEGLLPQAARIICLHFQLDLDIAFIRLEKEKFKEMISNLLKLVRHCSS